MPRTNISLLTKIKNGLQKFFILGRLLGLVYGQDWLSLCPESTSEYSL
jgi:hypothetical protein